MNSKYKIVPYVILAAVTVFVCWLFAGRFGMFASTVDWISQHSVFPDYFRRQFYETGELFPEFAPGLGGGQNIYYFSYYGLYSPVILLSYLLPFVKMSDYLTAVSVLCLAVSVMLLYYWLNSCGFALEISLSCAVMFLLASPMVYQSYRQVMFVNYMPFLCMALTGVQRYWKTGKAGLYTAGVFLMIMTSFYFSIAGIFALMMYGLSRYRKMSLKWPLFRFGIPVLTAVCTSGILLVPTAYVLFARSGGAKEQNMQELFQPDFSVVRFAGSGYGIGLTTGIFAVLVIGLFYKNWKERLLSAGLLAVVTIPFFSWVLNGGLYVRDKALIPFLPLLLYMVAVYLDKMKRMEISFRANAAGYLAAVAWCAYSDFAGKQTVSAQRKEFLMFQSILLLVCFLVYWKKRFLIFLTVPSIVCLALFGIKLNGTEGNIISKSRYEELTDPAWEAEISDILSSEQGLYRLEQEGDSAKKKDNINRVWNTRQWISSVYSSSCQQDYAEFRKNIFQTEQPFRNALMQSAGENPLFQKLMGVKYTLGRAGDSDTFTVNVNRHAAPVIYATDRLLSVKEYEKLEFPYNQTALMQYAVIENGGTAKGLNPGGLREVRQADISISIAEEGGAAEESAEAGYSGNCWMVQAGHEVSALLEISEKEETEKDQHTAQYSEKKDIQKEVEGDILYLQFDVENHRRNRDVTVEVNGIRNKLSAKNHIYYNGNTTFTYAVRLLAGQTKAEILFGEGDYAISNIRGFLGSASILQEDALYQSQFYPDWEKTRGNRISGKVTVKHTGYLITSIPYDQGFTIKSDGNSIPVQKVNTAFLGAAVSEGEHQIEIEYHAPGVKMGKLVSVIGAVLWAGMLLGQCNKKAHMLENNR